MNINEQLRRDEGVRTTAYRDEFGNWTTGVGHLILPSEAWLIKATLTDLQVSVILNHDIGVVQKDLVEFDWYANLDPVRQAAIENMTFNLGLPKLLHFPTMIHCLSVKDWTGAHDAALNSVWATQVKDRAVRIAKQIKFGTWQ